MKRDAGGIATVIWNTSTQVLQLKAINPFSPSCVCLGRLPPWVVGFEEVWF